MPFVHITPSPCSTRKCICIWIFILLLLSSPAAAEDLVVPAFHFPPWFIVQNNDVRGINARILDELSDRLHLNIRYLECPFKRCLIHMKKGEADLMASLLKREEREVYMLYLAPPYKKTSTKAFYLKKGAGVSIKKYEDLFPLTIGVERGSQYFPRFDNDSRIKKHDVTNGADQLPRLLMLGRIDAFIETESSMDFQLKITPGLREAIQKAPFKYDREIPVYMAISKKSRFSGQLERFNRVMQEMVDQGKIDEIIRDFLAP